ncbi:MAG TPA: NUDIX hydrolase [Candidatus Nitrosocosmicus sp.]|nr:NUDIX hydrolase [Candidatus Nitrosocosmicus sp.]
MNTTQIVVLAIIKNDENKILLTKRYDPEFKEVHNKWQIPGGGLEFGELPENTAKREALEEVGIPIKIIKLVPFFETKIDHNWQGIFISYLCEGLSDEIVINDEATEYGWFSIDQINQMEQDNTILPKTIPIIRQIEFDLQS